MKIQSTPFSTFFSIILNSFKKVRIIQLTVLLLFAVPTFATNYYISSSSGKDSNDGLTKNTPWKELNRGSSVTFYPGDSILIKRGDTFEGAIADVFQGSPSQPIVIGSYGNGNLPILYGDMRGRTWIPISGRAGYYKAFLGGYGVILTGFWQRVDGAWKRSSTSGYNGYRGSNPATWESWLDQLIEGGVGTNLEHDTIFVHTWGNVPFPSRDSMRVYRYGNYIQPGSHDVIIRDLDVRNYYIPIVVTGSYNITTRKVNMRNGYSSDIRYITCQTSLIDSCVADSSGDSGIYLVGSHKCIVRNNIVQNVLLTLDGGISAGIDLCGIGILDNYAYGRVQDTIGYNLVEYNKFYNIYRGFTDWFYCIGDTVRYNEGHGASSSGSPMGTNLVMTHNTFTFRPAGGNGPNIGQLGTGNIDFKYNTLDSIVNGYAFWTSSNASPGNININHNTFKGVTSGTYGDYKAVSSVNSTDNYFFGTAGHWTRNGTTYSTLAGIQALGFELGSTLSLNISSPVGIIIATPDSLPANGGTITLHWTSINADSAIIDQGIGKVSLNSSKTLNVTQEKTFTLTLFKGVTSVKYSTDVALASPLPVQLTSFVGTVKGNNVELTWNTVTEINSNKFEIERRAAAQWEKIGELPAAGTSNIPHEYNYVDSLIYGVSETILYRLKTIDNDGSFQYSAELEVTPSSNTTSVERALLPITTLLAQNYPNPFNPSTTINYQLAAEGNVRLVVYDMIGREIAVLADGVKRAGYYSERFDGSRLSSGTYFARLESDGKYMIKKIVLMK